MEQRHDDGPVQQEIKSHVLLSAPYILYAVLLHLPQQDLLLIQQVCRIWREVITSSRVLQAALFFQPRVNAVVGETSNEAVRINPLLLSRFPAFFDDIPGYVYLTPTAHVMGPYYTTHRAESVRPWAQFVLDDDPSSDDAANEDPFLSVPDSLIGVPEHLDRTAAFRRPEASWRRMLSCLPPPAELQVQYGTSSLRPRAGTVRRLRFDNLDDRHASSPEDGSRRDECERRWLTFGLVYDIFEAAWFRDQPLSVGRWQFDWTFQDLPPRTSDDVPDDDEIFLMPSARDPRNRLMYGERYSLRNCFPNIPIGGPGRVLILLTGYANDQDLRVSQKRFRADFELQPLAGNAIELDEVMSYEIQ
jgi:hypothetical protein